MFYAGIDMDEHRELAQHVLNNSHVSLEHRHIVQKYLRYHEFAQANYSGEALPPRPEIRDHRRLQEMLAPWITNPDFSPIMRKDLSGLPKAFVMTCEFDVLRDEGIMYARRLQVNLILSLDKTLLICHLLFPVLSTLVIPFFVL